MSTEHLTHAKFIGLTDADRQLLRAFYPTVERHLPKMLEAFYARLMTMPHLASMFVTEERRKHAAKAQSQHWKRMFTAGGEAEYYDSVKRIGRVHNQLGLEPSWYLDGYTLIMSDLLALACESSWSRLQSRGKVDHLKALLAAINKVVILDINLVISVYLDEQEDDFKRRLVELASQYESTLGDFTASVSSSADSLKLHADAMAGRATETKTAAGRTAERSSEMSVNVQTISGAMEQMSASIQEISSQLNGAVSEMRDASALARDASTTVSELDKVASEIANVLGLIRDIADQTNLLALNATIEAARAGEAGKGFAVVASEVKNLAGQTGSATVEITKQVEQVQQASNRTVNMVTTISENIQRIEGIAQAIAGAVEQQNATTHEISNNVVTASDATQEVSDLAGQVEQTADQTTADAKSVADASAGMQHELASLSDETQRFVDKIRNLERRGETRTDQDQVVTVSAGTVRREGRLINRSLNGIGIRMDTSGITKGQTGSVSLASGEQLAIEVVGVSPVHLGGKLAS